MAAMVRRMKYLPDSREYPRLDGDILPLGEDWNYVSSSFVNGFLNAGKVLAACVINRYSRDPEDRDPVEYSMRRSGAQISEAVSVALPEDAIKLFEDGWTSFHTKLDIFRDDVFLLTKCGETYYRFWLDMDVSDCSVGRFRTSDSEECVIEEFLAYAKRAGASSTHCRPDMWRLQPEWLRGWMSW